MAIPCPGYSLDLPLGGFQAGDSTPRPSAPGPRQEARGSRALRHAWNVLRNQPTNQPPTHPAIHGTYIGGSSFFEAGPTKMDGFSSWRPFKTNQNRFPQTHTAPYPTAHGFQTSKEILAAQAGEISQKGFPRERLGPLIVVRAERNFWTK